ncbi:MAG: LamG-like jellyroll fold domain-containing protein, partial [Planctomycetota bacterium]|nr:LamG-like jellyroll fold domain-containing protein [Planctomycetota bacterium]
GNHDVYWRGPGRPPEEHEGRYEKHFGPLWYAFDHKDCRFIVMYTDEPNPETGERNFGKADCQRMSPAQLAWLEATLGDAKDRKHVFCFVHHPRWIGGRYGDDWTRVHRVLADAGNVRAVFGGHIHHMRYDGPRDGIEYVALATVGGGQSGHAPSAGWLHQFHHVTVRPDGIALASIPIGTTMDVRAITPDVSVGAATLARTRHRSHGRLGIGEGGAADGSVGWSIFNPTKFPLEVELVPGSADLSWSFEPDHAHFTIEPGGVQRADFVATRAATTSAPWREPSVTLSCDLLGESRRFPMVPRVLSLPVVPDFEAPVPSGASRMLELDGRGDAAIVAADSYDLPDGPFTLETWFQGDRFDGRTGLVTRTEDSEFGLFVSDGTPDFSVHLDGAYAAARGDRNSLQPGRWHHLAGVFDGEELRLYLDGVLLSATPASGLRTRNGLPFIVGADVQRDGSPTSYFDGRIDAVRLSRGPRYAGDSFEPSRSLGLDGDTVLLLDFDDRTGPWSWDRSPNRAHARMTGDAMLRKLD